MEPKGGQRGKKWTNKKRTTSKQTTVFVSFLRCKGSQWGSCWNHDSSVKVQVVSCWVDLGHRLNLSLLQSEQQINTQPPSKPALSRIATQPTTHELTHNCTHQPTNSAPPRKSKSAETSALQACRRRTAKNKSYWHTSKLIFPHYTKIKNSYTQSLIRHVHSC